MSSRSRGYEHPQFTKGHELFLWLSRVNARPQCFSQKV